ncbi:hypothetical protein F0562_021669 [Nyssa sinensis]|uniref:Ubiquitin-like-conjugating enzyme ATG10 n=1 Tax=Nyssa sinensis TaxID=561372 RepID=A0A5J5BKB3_9ASTE|nr:hypothetical protein F0562_021669 [Nyssa sinensis]
MVSNQSTINFSSWDGTLSSHEFYLAARAFADKWKRFNPAFPQWSWVPRPKLPWTAADEVDGYLSLENVFLPRSTEEDHDKINLTGEEGPSCSNMDEPIDNATLVQNYGCELHHYDFHILYSSSYRVPVLYFRAHCSDGQPLVLDDIEKDLPANSGKVLMESKWTFITQEEHPHLNRPWYILHPCGTSEWIKLLFMTEASLSKGGVAVEQYLVSWFSVVGQVIGIRIPFEMLNNCGPL